MSSARHDTLNKLTDDHRHSCHAFLKKPVPIWNRAFNKFPNLLSENDISQLKEGFSLLFKNNMKISDTGIESKADQEKVKNWCIDVIHAACQFMLEKNVIHPDIIQALDIKHLIKPENPEHVYALTSALVANLILEQIISESKELIDKHQAAFNAICFEINKNYAKWIQIELKKHGVEIKLEQMTAYQIFTQFVTEQKKPLIAAGVGIMLTTIAATIFNKFSSGKSESKEEKKLEQSSSVTKTV